MTPVWEIVRQIALPGDSGQLLVMDREDGVGGRTVCVVPGNLAGRASKQEVVRLLDEQDVANASLIATAPRLQASLQRLVQDAGTMDGAGDPRWAETRAALVAAAAPGSATGGRQGGEHHG